MSHGPTKTSRESSERTWMSSALGVPEGFCLGVAFLARAVSSNSHGNGNGRGSSIVLTLGRAYMIHTACIPAAVRKLGI